MSVDDYFNPIESVEFQAEFSVLSGFRAFRKALQHNETLQMLSNSACSYDDGAIDLAQRIRYLLDEIEGGPGAEYDVAITGYLYSLNRVNPGLANHVASSILKRGGLWWAVDLSLYIVECMQSMSNQAKPRIHTFALLSQTLRFPILRHQDVSRPETVVYLTDEVNVWSTCGLSFADTPQTIETATLSV